MLLGELLQTGARIGVSPDVIVDCWRMGTRDFYGGGSSIEVKATGRGVRTHRISSLAQLEPNDTHEEIFVYSVGFRIDPNSHETLPDYIGNVDRLLVDSNGDPLVTAHDAFQRKLSRWGYNSSHEGWYRNAEGISRHTGVPPRLYPVEQIGGLTIRDFVGGVMPQGVSEISYRLSLENIDPLSPAQERAVYKTLIAANAS